jgi:hypothetical protein
MSKSYSPGDVSLIIGGSIVKFDSVTVSRNEDKNTMTVGTQGEVTRTKNLSNLSTITVVLPQSSTDNAVLSAFEVANGVIPILVKDNGGSSLHTMPEAVITGVPGPEYSKEHVQREWVFQGDLPVNVIGGN